MSISSLPFALYAWGGGGGGAPLWPKRGGAPPPPPPYYGLDGEAPPERGIFFRLQVYKSVGVSPVEVYKWVGQSVIWVCEKAYKG